MNPALNYDLMRRMYLSGMSFGDIAKKQGVSKWSVANKLKRETLKRGEQWPLRPPLKTSHHTRWDSVPSCGVVGYLQDLHKHGVTYLEMSRKAGCHDSYVWELVAPNPRRTRLTREKASVLMRMVSYYEQKLGIQL